MPGAAANQALAGESASLLGKQVPHTPVCRCHPGGSKLGGSLLSLSLQLVVARGAASVRPCGGAEGGEPEVALVQEGLGRGAVAGGAQLDGELCGLDVTSAQACHLQAQQAGYHSSAECDHGGRENREGAQGGSGDGAASMQALHLQAAVV